MSRKEVRIGTRGSDLALWQAAWVKGQLEATHTGLAVGIEVIRTSGDRILDSPLSMIGDKGLFTKEIERALIAGTVDLAVHSLKDLPTVLPDGLKIGAVSEREDVRDVFLPHHRNIVRTLEGQPAGAMIATGSLRRRAQILSRWPSLRTMDIRGNVRTRMQKLDASSWAGMLLAAAGVKRLGHTERIGEFLDPSVILPAVGQGALALEIRSDDQNTEVLIQVLHHHSTARCVAAERALLRRLEGGCQIPVGAYGRVTDGKLVLDAVVASLDGSTSVRDSITGSPEEAERLGGELAERLLADGADEILRTIRTAAGAGEAG